MLATKGVNNETPYSNVQYLHPINEDTDTEVYRWRDGEKTRVGNWKGDTLPKCTYVMKDSDYLQENLSRDPTPASSAYHSAPVSTPVSDVRSDVASELEDSDTQPQPPESEDEPCARVFGSSPPPRPYQGTRPHW
jgi:hypothetical protein